MLSNRTNVDPLPMPFYSLAYPRALLRSEISVIWGMRD